MDSLRPGRFIGKLPRWLQKPAAVLRNLILHLSRRRKLAGYAGHFEDIQRILDLAVVYAHASGVEGHIAEFGTASGATARRLARSLAAQALDQAQARAPRLLYLFDSFEGLPEATHAVDRSSPAVVNSIWPAGGCQGLTAPELMNLVKRELPEQRIRIVEGWYSHSLPKTDLSGGLAVVHVDCDLYQSTMDALDYLFSKGLVNRGAIILFDDWLCNAANPDLGEQRAWRELVEKYAIQFTDLGCYSAAGWRFIVLSYTTAPPAR